MEQNLPCLHLLHTRQIDVSFTEETEMIYLWKRPDFTSAAEQMQPISSQLRNLLKLWRFRPLTPTHKRKILDWSIS